jgi:hypothetical protein
VAVAAATLAVGVVCGSSGSGRHRCCRSVQGLRKKNRNQTMIEAYICADYNLEILGQKWWALTNSLALRNCQNLVLGKNNQVLLMIGQILGIIADNTVLLLSTVHLTSIDHP